MFDESLESLSRSLKLLNANKGELSVRAQNERSGFAETCEEAYPGADLPGIDIFLKSLEVRQQTFAGLFSGWRSSGSQVPKFLQTDEEAGALVTMALRQRRLFLSRTKAGLRLLPIGDLQKLAFSPLRQARAEGAMEFVNVVTNPLVNRIRHCVRCGSYYIPTRLRRDSKYCQRSCGSRTTSAVSQQKARTKARLKKLNTIEQLCKQTNIRMAISSAGKRSKRLRVASRRLSASSRFLSRAMNKGELPGLSDLLNY